MPVLEECIGTLDFSAFNDSNKAEAGDANPGVMSSSDIKDFLDGIKNNDTKRKKCIVKSIIRP